MNKPGSHRGAASSKKKKFGAPIKKTPVPVVDKLRDFCDNVRIEAEKNSQLDKYTRTAFRCKDLAKKFKCRIGEVVKAVESLNREKLTSTVNKRFLGFNVLYEDARDKEDTSDVELFFAHEDCPICGTKMTKKETKRDIYGFENNKYVKTGSYVTSSRTECKNKCFLYDADRSGHTFKIFNDTIIVHTASHKSLVNYKLKQVKREINRFKKNERYVVEIMMKDL